MNELNIHYMPKSQVHSHKVKGFTLLELSVVLVLIAFIIAGGLVTLTASIQTSQYNATIAQMQAIDKALMNFRTAFNRLPCPAQLSLATTSVNYGLEAGTNTPGITSSTIPSSGVGNGICKGTIKVSISGVLTNETTTPAADFLTTASTTLGDAYDLVAEGGVPTRALQLPDSYMYDAWGRKIRYAVDVNMTATNAFVTQTSNFQGGAITVNGGTINGTPGGVRTTNAVYALISHGANGHGAYTQSGATVNAGSTNTDEQTNCDCNSLAVHKTGTGSYTATYVQALPVLNSASLSGIYDDLVSYKMRWQMIPPSGPTGSTLGGLYVADDFDGNEFATNGNIINAYSTIVGNTYAGFAFNIVTGAFVVVNEANNSVEMYNQSGTFVSQFPCAATGSPARPVACTAGHGINQLGASGEDGAGVDNNCANKTGPCYGVSAIATDSLGFTWVVDVDNNRVLEFNASGVSAHQLGCASGTACESITNGGFGDSVYPQWGIAGIAVDSQGNIWVSDTGNNRVEEFNNARTFIKQLGCSSGPCTTPNAIGGFSGPGMLAFDPFGNLWVQDTNNSRIEEFNATTGMFIKQIGCPGTSACTASSVTGQFDFNGQNSQFSSDAQGNIWVAEMGNHRIQEFNNNGEWMMTIGGGGVCVAGGSCACTPNVTTGSCTITGPPSTTNACTATAGCNPTPSAQANGYFDQPTAIATGWSVFTPR